MSSLAEHVGSTHNPGVEQPLQAPTELPLRPQDEVECRRCEGHCDKVVYPGACLERSCPFVYAYEAWGHTYVGCMQRVYGVEIDLDLLRAAEESLRRRPARVEVAQLLHLRRVGTVVVRAGRLHDRGQALHGGVGEEDAELLAQLAREHVRVPVAVRAERCGGVVHVERPQAVEADASFDLREHGNARLRLADIDA